MRRMVERMLGEDSRDEDGELGIGAAARILEAEVGTIGDASDEQRLGRATPHARETTPESLVPGARFGDYDIVREIARGGMGAVFEAKQRSLGRTVALKVVLGARFASDRELQRFRVEAESIARLDHPGIVPVYEVGEIDGEHFFSMAFLPGGSLDGLDLPMQPLDAARLVETVAEAVQFAHSRNIVHRDLKPANVLLTENGSPKVGDFGIAKDTGQGDGEDLTRPGSILGTPGFLSPEQARGDLAAVGPPADVYGIGGILYYLLTGQAPIRGHGLLDTMQRVLHEEPTPANRVVTDVPIDLATICGKCLEKDPARRYASAAALREDLGRFLRGETVSARSVGGATRFAKWCRRRPGVAVSLAVAAVAVIVGITAATWFGVIASRRAGDMEAFGEFLVEDVIRATRFRGVQGGLGRNITVHDALVRSIDSVGERFAGRPLAEALARHELGVTLRIVGEGELAEEQLRRALELRRDAWGPTDDRTLDTMNSLGSCLAWQGRHQEALAVYEKIEALDTDRSYSGRPEFHGSRGAAIGAAGDLARERRILEELIAEQDDELLCARWQLRLGRNLRASGDFAESVHLLRGARAALFHVLGPDHPESIAASQSLGFALIDSGSGAEAIPLLEDTLQAAEEVLGAEHELTRGIYDHLTKLYDHADEHEKALVVARRFIEFEREQAGETVRYFHALSRTAMFHWKLGQHAEAVEVGLRALPHFLENEPNTWMRHSLQSILATCLARLDRHEDAVFHGEQGLAALAAASEPLTFADRAEVGYREALGKALFAVGRYSDAVPHLRSSLDYLSVRSSPDGESAGIANRRLQFADALMRSENFREASRVLETGLERTRFPEDHRQVAVILSMLGAARLGAGDVRGAVESLERSNDAFGAPIGDTPPAFRRMHAQRLIDAYEQHGDADRAAHWRRVRAAIE